MRELWCFLWLPSSMSHDFDCGWVHVIWDKLRWWEGKWLSKSLWFLERAYSRNYLAFIACFLCDLHVLTNLELKFLLSTYQVTWMDMQRRVCVLSTRPHGPFQAGWRHPLLSIDHATSRNEIWRGVGGLIDLPYASYKHLLMRYELVWCNYISVKYTLLRHPLGWTYTSENSRCHFVISSWIDLRIGGPLPHICIYKVQKKAGDLMGSTSSYGWLRRSHLSGPAVFVWTYGTETDSHLQYSLWWMMIQVESTSL